MAKPIKSIPELRGAEADLFLEKMIKLENSKITPRQKRFAREIEKNMKLLVVA